MVVVLVRCHWIDKREKFLGCGVLFLISALCQGRYGRMPGVVVSAKPTKPETFARGGGEAGAGRVCAD